MSCLKELTEDTRRFLTEYFTDMDDGDGYLDARELEKSIQLVGLCPTRENMDFLFEFFDKEKKGKIRIKELVDNIDVLVVQSVRSPDLHEAFKMFDKNGDGFIRLPELEEVLSAGPNKMEVDDMRNLLSHLINNYDDNGDGKFDYNEFANILANEDPLHLWKKAKTMDQQTKK